MSCAHHRQEKGVCIDCKRFVCTHAVVREGRCLYCEKEGRFETGEVVKTDLELVADNALFKSYLGEIFGAVDIPGVPDSGAPQWEARTKWAVEKISAHQKRTNMMRAALVQLLALHGVEAQEHDTWNSLLDLWEEKKVSGEPVCQLGIAGRRFCVLHGHDMALRQGWKHGCADCGFVHLSEVRDQLKKVFGEGLTTEDLVSTAEAVAKKSEHWENTLKLLELEEPTAVYAEIGRLKKLDDADAKNDMSIVIEKGMAVDRALLLFQKESRQDEPSDLDDFTERIGHALDATKVGAASGAYTASHVEVHKVTGKPLRSVLREGAYDVDSADVLDTLMGMLEAVSYEEVVRKVGLLQDDKIRPLNGVEIEELDAIFKERFGVNESPPLRDIRFIENFVLSKWQKRWGENGEPAPAPVGANRPSWEDVEGPAMVWPVGRDPSPHDPEVKQIEDVARKFLEAFQKPYRGVNVAARVDDAADITSVRAIASVIWLILRRVNRLEKQTSQAQRDIFGLCDRYVALYNRREKK